MADVSHVKYAKLIEEIEVLEAEVEVYEKGDGIKGESDDDGVLTPEEIQSELQTLQERLAAKRNELKRLSDGCGAPRTH